MRLVLLSLLLISAASAAQEAPADSMLGALTGVVTEAETGEPMVGANIWVPEVQRGAFADMDGRYTLPRLKPGVYIIEVRFAGYEMQVFEEVEIRAGEVATLNVQMTWHRPSPTAWCFDVMNLSISIYSSIVVSRFRCDSTALDQLVLGPR